MKLAQILPVCKFTIWVKRSSEILVKIDHTRETSLVLSKCKAHIIIGARNDMSKLTLTMHEALIPSGLKAIEAILHWQTVSPILLTMSQKL